MRKLLDNSKLIALIRENNAQLNITGLKQALEETIRYYNTWYLNYDQDYPSRLLPLKVQQDLSI